MLAHLVMMLALANPAQLPAQTLAPTTPAPAEISIAETNPRVILVTTLGEIELELDAVRAPKTVANFLSYIDDGHYNGTVFHRVVADMLIQGGGFTPDLQHKPTRAPVASEANNGLSNTRGTLVAARAPNAADSATAQFFINTVDNLDFNFSSETSDFTRGYTVFGRVVHGLDIVDRIRVVATSAQPPFASGVPKTPIIIERAQRIAAPSQPPAQTPAESP